MLGCTPAAVLLSHMHCPDGTDRVGDTPVARPSQMGVETIQK